MTIQDRIDAYKEVSAVEARLDAYTLEGLMIDATKKGLYKLEEI